MNAVRSISVLALCSVLSCAACSPALDWREIRPEGSGAIALFPCKPSREVRRVRLAGASIEMTVVACRAGGAMYALAFLDAGDPSKVGVALSALGDAAAANLDASSIQPLSVNVSGMTPHSQAHGVTLVGRLPDGRPVHERLALFAKGTRVFQATMLGERLDAEALDTFFNSLHVPK
ncbi:MAG TPA: hypothetical protein VFP68_23015 [Burkholderiaceae bacterium]|nr:hypothetical protein [Burkholderiaceae bacterium]